MTTLKTAILNAFDYMFSHYGQDPRIEQSFEQLGEWEKVKVNSMQPKMKGLLELTEKRWRTPEHKDDAGFDFAGFARDVAERARQEEREACAKVCDDIGTIAAGYCAAAIRARSSK